MIPQPHILIAEDDFEDRYLMTGFFRELGHSDLVTFVEDGSVLISHLAGTDAADIGLIVLDLNMPRMNGTETLRALKQELRYRDIPVIIFSTSIHETEKQLCLELGARGYITKPSKYADYLDTCRSFLAISRERSDMLTPADRSV